MATTTVSIREPYWDITLRYVDDHFEPPAQRSNYIVISKREQKDDKLHFIAEYPHDNKMYRHQQKLDSYGIRFTMALFRIVGVRSASTVIFHTDALTAKEIDAAITAANSAPRANGTIAVDIPTAMLTDFTGVPACDAIVTIQEQRGVRIVTKMEVVVPVKVYKQVADVIYHWFHLSPEQMIMSLHADADSLASNK